MATSRHGTIYKPRDSNFWRIKLVRAGKTYYQNSYSTNRTAAENLLHNLVSEVERSHRKTSGICARTGCGLQKPPERLFFEYCSIYCQQLAWRKDNPGKAKAAARRHYLREDPERRRTWTMYGHLGRDGQITTSRQ